MTDTTPLAQQIAAYDSVDQQRAALRKALRQDPGNTRFKKMLQQRVTPQHVREAATRGVFISYERASELFALELAEDLRGAGVDVWLDALHIPEDGDWHREIAAALERCGLMLLVVSPDMPGDDDVRRERAYFRDHGKLMLPVIAEPCDIDDLGLLVAPVNFAYSYKAGLRTLLRLLQSSEAQA